MLALQPIHVSISSPAHGTWTERIEGGYIGGEIDDIKFSAWARCYSPDDQSDFTWMTIEAGYNSDIGSPPLWKNSGSPVIPIAQDQLEMMGISPDASDADYEPSLKDIVLSSPIKEMKSPMQNRFGRGKEPERPTKKFSRTESMDRGAFLLKIYSPFPTGLRRNSSIEKTGSKLLPKRDDDDSVNKNINNFNNKKRILSRLRTFFWKSYSSFDPSRK